MHKNQLPETKKTAKLEKKMHHKLNKKELLLENKMNRVKE